APAKVIDFRGPARSTQRPPMAAEIPSMAMATEKIQATDTSPLSNRETSGVLNTEKAYTCPMHRWMANAAGGMSHRLKLREATIASRSKICSTAVTSVSLESPLTHIATA